MEEHEAAQIRLNDSLTEYDSDDSDVDELVKYHCEGEKECKEKLQKLHELHEQSGEETNDANSSNKRQKLEPVEDKKECKDCVALEHGYEFCPGSCLSRRGSRRNILLGTRS